MNGDSAPPRDPWFAPVGLAEVPVGSVVAFAGQLGTSVPPGPPDASPPIGTTSPIEAWGWMACDGRTLQVFDYPELFAVLSYLYGGSGDSFMLPDYRGYFLRGVDAGTGIDPDSSTRTPAAGGKATGVGSTQASALLSHKHDFPESVPAGVAEEGTDAGVPSTTSQLTGVPVADDGSALGDQVSQKETRPVNVYVNFIIRFTAAPRPATALLSDRGE